MSPTTAHLHESAAEILIELELPHPADELEVSVVERTVTVTCGRDTDPEGFGKREKGSPAVHRELQLPVTADVDHLSATLRPGTLELRAPRLRPRPRRIPVRRLFEIDPDACPD